MDANACTHSVGCVFTACKRLNACTQCVLVACKCTVWYVTVDGMHTVRNHAHCVDIQMSEATKQAPAHFGGYWQCQVPKHPSRQASTDALCWVLILIQIELAHVCFQVVGHCTLRHCAVTPRHTACPANGVRLCFTAERRMSSFGKTSAARSIHGISPSG